SAALSLGPSLIPGTHLAFQRFKQSKTSYVCHTRLPIAFSKASEVRVLNYGKILSQSESCIDEILNDKYNVKKSEVKISKAGAKCPKFVPLVKINGVAFQMVYKFKYLGHVVSEDLEDNADMDRERRAMSVHANMLARRFSRCTDAVKI
ncbi:jg3028, partial [Pararge aegeria aegeria]